MTPTIYARRGMGYQPMRGVMDRRESFLSRRPSNGLVARATGRALLLLALLVVNTTQAQELKAGEARVLKLTVHPAAAPVPALKYSLLPKLIEQTPGNAAALYMIASNQLQTHPVDPEVVQKWLDKPLSEAAKDQAVPAMIQPIVVDMLDEASRRAYCHWETTLRTQGMSALLPYLNGMRDAARLLAVRSRQQMSAGEMDAAVNTLRTGVTMARHLNEQDAVLIQILVGGVVFDQMADRLHELSERRGAPNLYWALAQLPRPFFDVHRVTQFERYVVELSFPELRNIDTLSDEQGKKVLQEIFRAASGGDGADRPGESIARTLLLAAAYPKGKQYLKSRGVPAERVEKMTVHQVILRYLMDDMTEHFDEQAKWFALPYPQARAGMEKSLKTINPHLSENVLLRLLMPSLTRARSRMAAVDRRVALLMCVEGIRAYAAANRGKLPHTLNDLAETTPAPDDPMTGKPFPYRVEGEVGVIEAPAAEEPPARSVWRVEVRITK